MPSPTLCVERSATRLRQENDAARKLYCGSVLEARSALERFIAMALSLVAGDLLRLRHELRFCRVKTESVTESEKRLVGASLQVSSGTGNGDR